MILDVPIGRMSEFAGFHTSLITGDYASLM
jgi:hypothetical protein